MSETGNGMPDIAAGDNEPSMEDILSSIRKIIADDKSDETNLALNPEPAPIDVPDPVEDLLENVVEEEQLSVDDFKIPDIESDDNAETLLSDIIEDNSDADEILELIDLADEPPVVADVVEGVALTEDDDLVTFDESLDLVMDSDVSDYLEENEQQSDISPDKSTDENIALREEIESEFEIDEPEIDEVSLSPEPDVTVEVENVEPGSSLEEQVEEVDDIFDRFENTLEDEDMELAPELDDVDDLPDADSLEGLDKSAPTGDDQDMDLVKSLLADLLEEPEGIEEIEAESEVLLNEDTAEQSGNILDEILNKSIEDEVEIAAQEEAVVEQSSQISDDDKVELPERTLKGRLSIGKKSASATGFFMGGAAAVAAGSDDGDSEEDEDGDFWSSEIAEADDETDGLEEIVNEIVKEEIVSELVEEEIEVLVEESIEEPTKIQEEDTMVRAVKKKEAIVDDNTEQESGEAFATLTNVVREKADLEESGPPIGDLVQDALRPMLKEWLDKNLKGIVERAVTKEVKRISSGK